MANDGALCLKSELDLFNNVGTQLSIDSSAFGEIHPISPLTDKTPIEFHISGSGENYIDLAHTILHLRIKILKKPNTNLVAADNVAPINFILNTSISFAVFF